jgi:hypothetical protein
MGSICFLDYYMDDIIVAEMSAASKEAMKMTTLIHIAVLITNEELVRNTVVNCCSETGDTLIGQRVYEEVGEVLLVVRLVQNYNVTKHIPILSQALQRELILSFQIEMINLVRVECPAPLDIRHQVQDFPLQPNESWFPAVESEQMAYICTRGLLLQPSQEQWLEGHHLDYTYA